MAATASANSLTSAFLSPQQGFHGSSHHQSVKLRTQKKQFVRKAGSGTITAKFELQPPPYPMDALEPHMSSRTFEFHWGKHHRAYVDNLNKQIDGTELDGKTLEDIILLTYNKGSPFPTFNNAAQAWNHQFFWESMKPNGGGEPSGELLDLINRDFGSFDTFVKEFKAAAATQFGSGWAWLAYKPKEKKLALVKTPNAENPLVLDYIPLLTIDVWEHAYYLDFQNRRPDYISIFMEQLVSWEAVSSRLKAVTA
ncbi:Fibronectin type III and SPRY domain-containing protein 1 [Datura stramonium]|uniref:Superoxide dismutase n=1 Tax=Datura stramonium TaxID=4076 RepID=A0ABS8TNT7_DATST|nr:Fibronectin type III and SPRY domain-containing protein 1 [Datura stramonium]